ncbi:MAG: hypothetical protein BA863_11410 [Desulfovibrio sp. S3730MH75]|nr:MAG: hypothetical protein BA863_11410 [Desulfovibrio sp. S3730MH75]
MTCRIFLLMALLMSIAACSVIPMSGDVTSSGEILGAAEMSATRDPGLKSYNIVSELPDGTIYRGSTKSSDKSATLFTNDGESMECVFKVNNLSKGFESGGTGSCTTSEGQQLDVKF